MLNARIIRNIGNLFCHMCVNMRREIIINVYFRTQATGSIHPNITTISQLQ